MSKGSKIPTIEEILSYKEMVRQNPAAEASIEGKTNLREMTFRIMKAAQKTQAAEQAWQFCKTLAKFSHAPVSAADYKRMQKFVDDTELIDIVLIALEGYYPTNENSILSGFDVIGFYYCIALISQTLYKKQEIFDYLSKLTDYMLENNNSQIAILHRNMKKLEKEFPDLKPLRMKLEDV